MIEGTESDLDPSRQKAAAVIVRDLKPPTGEWNSGAWSGVLSSWPLCFGLVCWPLDQNQGGASKTVHQNPCPTERQLVEKSLYHPDTLPLNSKAICYLLWERWVASLILTICASQIPKDSLRSLTLRVLKLTVWWTCVSVVSQAISSPISSEINFPKAPSSHFDLRNLAIFGHLWPSSLTLEILKLHHLTKLHHSPSHLLHSPRISTSTRKRLDFRNSWLNFIYIRFGPLRELRHPISPVQLCSYH